MHLTGLTGYCKAHGSWQAVTWTCTLWTEKPKCWNMFLSAKLKFPSLKYFQGVDYCVISKVRFCVYSFFLPSPFVPLQLMCVSILYMCIFICTYVCLYMYREIFCTAKNCFALYLVLIWLLLVSPHMCYVCFVFISVSLLNFK